MEEYDTFIEIEEETKFLFFSNLYIYSILISDRQLHNESMGRIGLVWNNKISFSGGKRIREA